MIKSFHKKRKHLARIMLLVFCLQWAQMPLALALTSGPTQPEVQGFQPAGTSEMVDLFTGDFSYNIPLFELPGPNGGYPFNLSYQSGITMDQEASWVGLGWSLNPGAVNRQMRGVPDEFMGDPILTKTTVAPSATVGLGAGGSIEIFGGNLRVGMGLGVSLNSYKGLGYSIDYNLGFGKTASGGRIAGLDVSLNSKEGVGVNPSLTLGNKIGSIGLGLPYNSKTGLSSMTLSQSVNLASLSIGKEQTKKNAKGFSSSAAISLAHPGYTPQITMPMKNISLTAQINLGADWYGFFPHGYVRGFYNEQWLKNDKQVVMAKAYGYFNLQKSTGEYDLLDLNREKDGMVSQVTPNLAMPTMTYDIYSVTGQGIGAMYRPMRNDMGVIHDQEVASESVDASLGVDAGIFKLGVNLSVNHSKSTSGKWIENNLYAADHPFLDANQDSDYEPWYFKSHGEPSSDASDYFDKIGGDQSVRVAIGGDGATKNFEKDFKLDGGFLSFIALRAKNTLAAPSSAAVNQKRKSRNQVIQHITNGQLLQGSNEMLSLFKIQYLSSIGETLKFNRSSLPKHHLAGMTALTPEGLRYNYGIPAYNTYQEDVSFTTQKPSLNTPVNRVNAGNNGKGEPVYQYGGTDQFLRTSKMPPYAHAYLLTSIIGPDYVDVTDDGITPDDLGYWVKFTYQKMNSASNPYRWRDPYSQAHYQEGWKTDPRDDRGSFTYGEKELWYLAQAETKSHIATFKLQTRLDGKGVAQKLQDTNAQGMPVYALQEIDLYARSAVNNYKIKVVKFDYDYSLCAGVYNNTNLNSSNGSTGKLTLKKLTFQYGSSDRGKLNPYNFTYHQSNPNYNLYAYDRWGTYKPYEASDPLQNIDAPYSLQDPAQKSQIDANAASWSLTEIQLPSGGKIMVNYETDDYAYVQQQRAGQMMELVDPYSSPTGTLNDTYSLQDGNLKVRFRLETPIAGSQVVDPKQEVLKYLDVRDKQLYFKTKINLRGTREGFYEYVMGYANIDFKGSMGLEKDGSGNYRYGYFYLLSEKGHPFSLRAWQHLRTNQPELANSDAKLAPTNDNGKRISQIKSLGSIITQVRQMFEGFNSFCAKRGWGRQVIASKSWVRLSSPDKIKYGGGLRVRQVTMKDQWAQDEEGTYGQVYEYTTQEGNTTISSGVAAYEPIVGGDENAMHYAKKFTESVPLRSDNNLYFEFPINESYFPGPQVGYSKVTVTSLAAASLAGKQVFNSTLSDGKPLFPSGNNVSYGTSGMTVHEFYTARDFPVITDETQKFNQPYKVSTIIPLVGSISISNLTASQGYTVITNDMHGKQKKVSNYRQDKTGRIEPEPISWVKYNYRTQTAQSDRGKSSTINNVFKDNGDGTLSIPTDQELKTLTTKYLIGQETELITDMRQFKDFAYGGGANLNTDWLLLPFFGLLIPIPSDWPNVSKDSKQLRTAVTNKVIFKTGVLQSTEVFNEGSHVTTQNLKWDKQTGVPVLTMVTNDFDAPIYDYNIPAYTQYQGMGGAYKNTGLSFSLSDVKADFANGEYTFTAASTLTDGLLFPGDEMLLYTNTTLTTPVARAVYMGEEDGTKKIYSTSPLSGSAFSAMIIRSGYRNQLSVMAGSIKALQDPSVPGTSTSHPAKVVISGIKQ